jgi:predicted SnoaL-like aldol condensation-catalyzing enzyme
LAEELIADTMIRHDVGESRTLTRAEALKRVTDTWAEMDSLRFDLDLVIDGGDGEHVAMVWNSTMTKGDDEVKVASIEVFRVVDGQIVEVWNCGYKLGVWA